MVTLQLPGSIALREIGMNFIIQLSVFVCCFNNNQKTKWRLRFFDISNKHQMTATESVKETQTIPNSQFTRVYNKNGNVYATKIKYCCCWLEMLFCKSFFLCRTLATRISININSQIGIHMWWFCGCYSYWNTNNPFAW